MGARVDTVAGPGADLWSPLVKEDARPENQEVLLARVPLLPASNEAAKAKSGNKTAYLDSEGAVNWNLKLVGTVTMRQMDWWGRVTSSKTSSINLTK
ncbi:hypothetical protein D3C86_1878970 [compost metagenome]